MGVPQQALLGTGGGDSSFANVVLLCHFDGTNGSTTFTDQSNSAHTMAPASGGGAITTSVPKFGTGSLDTSVVFHAANVSGTPADFQFGAGQFTIEAWVYRTGTNGNSNFPVVIGLWNAGGFSWEILLNTTTNFLYFQYSLNGSTSTAVGAAYTLGLNSWVHIAADRDGGGVMRIYADGVVIASATQASALSNQTFEVVIGNDDNSGGLQWFPGHIDEVRVTKGVARYGGAFTPPTAAFPNS